ncbi:MAG: hypothetical protein U0Q18_02100 [Bryobacteraceae bacterium]
MNFSDKEGSSGWSAQIAVRLGYGNSVVVTGAGGGASLFFAALLFCPLPEAGLPAGGAVVPLPAVSVLPVLEAASELPESSQKVSTAAFAAAATRAAAINPAIPVARA